MLLSRPFRHLEDKCPFDSLSVALLDPNLFEFLLILITRERLQIVGSKERIRPGFTNREILASFSVTLHFEIS